MSTRLLKDRIISAVLTTTLLPVIACAPALAQRETSERVRFPPGRTTAVLRGRVSGKASHVYLLSARKGQHMSVHLSGQSGPVFDISRPDGSGLSELQVRDWEGELPATGTYRIHVEGETERLPARGYTLEISIR